jgi:hypothetical protein
MWFYPVLIAVVLLAIVGGTLAGGVYTLVLVPLAVVVIVSALVYSLWGRAIQGSAGAATDAGTTNETPLPHQPQRPRGRAPSSPERLADARRQQQ